MSQMKQNQQLFLYKKIFLFIIKSSRIWYALFLELCTIIIASLILFISYSILRYTDIPVTIIGSSIENLTSSTAYTADSIIL